MKQPIWSTKTEAGFVIDILEYAIALNNSFTVPKMDVFTFQGAFLQLFKELGSELLVEALKNGDLSKNFDMQTQLFIVSLLNSFIEAKLYSFDELRSRFNDPEFLIRYDFLTRADEELACTNRGFYFVILSMAPLVILMFLLSNSIHLIMVIFAFVVCTIGVAHFGKKRNAILDKATLYKKELLFCDYNYVEENT